MNNNMLQSLVKYAKTKGISDDPSERNITVIAAIHLDNQGRYKKLVEYNSESKKSGKSVRAPSNPATQIRSGTSIRGYFLVDNASYVLGLGETKNKEAKHNDFYGLIQRAYKNTGYAPLQAILNFSNNQSDIDKACKDVLDLKNPGLLCFNVDGEEIINQSILMDFNKSLIQDDDDDSEEPSSKKKDPSVEDFCLICGQKGKIANKHLKIKGFPGNDSGVALFSNNQTAFRSYHHKSNGMQNAPICFSCVTLYSNALDLLLKGNPEKDTKSQCVKLNSDSYSKVIVFWSDQNDDSADFLQSVLENKIEETTISQLISMIVEGKSYNGRTIEQYDLENFNVAVFGSQKGRISIRAYGQTTVGDMYRNMLTFLRRTTVKNSQGDSIRPSLRDMAKSAYPFDNQSHERGAVCEQIINSLLFHEKFSDNLFESLIDRMVLEHGYKASDKRLYRNANTIFNQCATLYFCLHNHLSLHGKDNELGETMSLERECESMPYLIGRLLAIADSAQYNFLNQKRARLTVSERYIDSLVKSPILDIGEFMKEATFYLQKASPLVRKEAEEVFDLMGSKKFSEDGLVAHNSHQQALVILGYQSQKNELFRSFQLLGKKGV